MRHTREIIAALGGWLILSLTVAAAPGEVVVVVADDNPIISLTRAELVDIFLGRRSRFPTGEPVIPINQEETSPAYVDFYTNYLGRSPAQVKAHWSKLIFTGRGHPPKAVENGEAAAEFVAANPNAIAYIEPDLVDERLRVVKIE